MFEVDDDVVDPIDDDPFLNFDLKLFFFLFKLSSGDEPLISSQKLLMDLLKIGLDSNPFSFGVGLGAERRGEWNSVFSYESLRLKLFGILLIVIRPSFDSLASPLDFLLKLLLSKLVFT